MPERRAEGAGLDGEGADRAIIVIAAMRAAFGHCPRDQVPDFTHQWSVACAKNVETDPISAI